MNINYINIRLYGTISQDISFRVGAYKSVRKNSDLSKISNFAMVVGRFG